MSEIDPNTPVPTEKTVSSRTAYTGTVVTIRHDEAELPDGKIRPRDVVMHPGGVVALPILDAGTPSERIVMIEQYRYPLGLVLMELPAGKLDPPEHPDDAVKRELAEETGYEADCWEKITHIFPTPGFCDEKLHLYKATGLRKASHVATEDDEEFIRVLELTPAQVWAKMQAGEIVDAKSIVAFSLVYGSLQAG